MKGLVVDVVSGAAGHVQQVVPHLADGVVNEGVDVLVYHLRELLDHELDVVSEKGDEEKALGAIGHGYQDLGGEAGPGERRKGYRQLLDLVQQAIGDIGVAAHVRIFPHEAEHVLDRDELKADMLGKGWEEVKAAAAATPLQYGGQHHLLARGAQVAVLEEGH